MSWLVDTNVISELSRNAPNAKVRDWIDEREDSLFISVLTIGELERGIRKVTEKARRSRLELWLHDSILPWFQDRVLVIDQPIAVRWGELSSSAKGTLPIVDSLIAATALHHGLTVATRNIRDLQRTGVSIVNPWDLE